jgi:hypothetical protein
MHVNEAAAAIIRAAQVGNRNREGMVHLQKLVRMPNAHDQCA